MARLFRSKSCSPDSSMPAPVHDGGGGNFEEEDDDDNEVGSENPATTPFLSPARNQPPQFSVLGVVASALRKSLVTCSVEADDVASDVDIGWPTDVRHVSHVTFDRFDGFLGLPVELQPDVPRKPPSASASVFGVSAESMQCAYDQRGNSIPSILLRMQTRLYSEGGLRAEGIFRINAENSKEEHVRNQLNKGVVPHGIDVHCLSGLIKAWFRELPSGILDCLTPEQVMHCNTEEECAELVKLLPPTEAALLDWAINLMADVAQHEHHNKMNARNIAMVFAPNMTQMADPLTALIHAVQVMNFLKTLIGKTLGEREESAACTTLFTECSDAFESIGPSNGTEVVADSSSSSFSFCKETSSENLLRSSTLERLECDNNEKSLRSRSKSDVGERFECTIVRSSTSPAVTRKRRTLGHSFKDEYDENNTEAEEGILYRLGLRKGMQKLCRHPVFQLSKTAKKSGRSLAL
ncbi:Rho GTPase activating protein with PAK-box/P21-Rho-binding domain-containing protein [Perilla frutescens var. hirtella]|nr:Rho GTPase activating protein with PAK-box/P21-Rho-binding domain-containing protein [Perilla frutescens var. hirtella]KAH6819643.1 Rho GTPase activating protein with PAK-box/P21-Rho-binding domain-containing protein [Perilla frutescens var. frutescens]